MPHASFGTSKRASPRRSSAIPSMRNRRRTPNGTAVDVITTIRLNTIMACVYAHARNRCRSIALSGRPLAKRRGHARVLLGLSSVSYQMSSIKRRSQPLVRSSSVHDLNRHEVFRANELDFGPIIGQGFYGIARTVSERHRCTAHGRARF